MPRPTPRDSALPSHTTSGEMFSGAIPSKPEVGFAIMSLKTSSVMRVRADGWQPGPAVDKSARWAPDEIGAAVHGLIAKAPAPQKVYGA